MVNASLISRPVDAIESRSQQNRPQKLVTIRCCRDEDRDAARDRHSRPATITCNDTAGRVTRQADVAVSRGPPLATSGEVAAAKPTRGSCDPSDL